MLRVAILLCLGLASTAIPGSPSENGVGGSPFHKNDITYSTSVATPHVPWATRLPGGPIKGFFIPSVQYGRDMVELMQRLELAPTTVSIDRNWDINCWGIGDYYGHETRGDRDDFRIVYGYVEKDLTGSAPFEVMVIPGLNGWTRMTRASRDAILRRVAAGAGLVLIHPFVGDVARHPFAGDERKGDERIWEVSPLTGCLDDTVGENGYPQLNREAIAVGKWEIARPHFITSGLPLDLLPEGRLAGSFYKYRAAGDVLIQSGGHPVLAVRTYGKGRVAAFGYVEDGFIPSGTSPFAATDDDGDFSTGVNPYSTGIYWPYWEYHYSLLVKAIVWAAGRDAGIDLRSTSLQLGNEDSLEARLAARAGRKVEIEVRAQSQYGSSFGSLKHSAALRPGSNAVTIPLSRLKPASGWPGGKNIFDFLIRDPESGATLNWGTATAEIVERSRIMSVRPATDVYRKGEVISSVVRASGDLEGLKFRFRVSDDLERVLSEQEAPASGERYFYFTLDHFLGRHALLAADLVDSKGRLIDQVRAQPVLVVQESRRAKEFNPLVAFGASRHMFQAVRMRQVRAVAADTGFTWGGRVNNGLNIPRGAFGVYWYDRGPTTAEGMEKAIADFHGTQDFDALRYLTKKELYRRTGDTRFLARVPSFSDPAFLRRLRSIVHAVARGKSRYNMDYYFVGDEGSLTSYTDPYDFDWSPQALSSFREWLQGEYRTLDALNRTWKASYSRWDDVLPATTEQAMASRNYAPWADHRTFMEKSFAGAYRAVREAVTAGDPEGHIALSGTQVTTAYNGCDWYRLDQVIDHFLSYDGGNQWDLHRSFAKPGSMIGFWTGYESRGIPLQNAIWTAATHNVLYPNVFWMLSFLNPDFTYSHSARDMGEVYKILKYGGVGKLLMESERLHDGIAVHYSMPSVHAASITLHHPERGRPEIGRDFPADRDGWVRMIKDLGLQFNFVSYEQIERDLLRQSGYRVLVLPMSMALSPTEARAIRDFAAGGGIVIADAAAGLMDHHCAWKPDGVLNDLFGIRTRPSDQRRLAGSSRIEQNTDGDITGRARTPGIAGAVRILPEGGRWGLRDEDLRGIEAVEAGLTADTGRALLQVNGTDAVVVRQVGKGWAVYLNVLLDRYADQRAKGFQGGNHRTLIRALLDRLGVLPAVRVNSAGGIPVAQAQIVRYRFGDRELLAVVKEDVGTEAMAGRDGVTVYTDANLGRLAKEEITVQLSGRLHVTDVIAGHSVGERDSVPTSIIAGGALVLGMGRGPISVSISGPQRARRGEALRFEIRASGASQYLLRCHFLAPDGSFLPVYARNVLVDGAQGSLVLPSALNDAAGRYTLLVTDIVSGSSSRMEFLLE